MGLRIDLSVHHSLTNSVTLNHPVGQLYSLCLTSPVFEELESTRTTQHQVICEEIDFHLKCMFVTFVCAGSCRRVWKTWIIWPSGSCSEPIIFSFSWFLTNGCDVFVVIWSVLELFHLRNNEQESCRANSHISLTMINKYRFKTPWYNRLIDSIHTSKYSP